VGDEALRLSRQRGTRGYEAWALWILGETEAQRGDGAAPEAETFTRQARALAETLGMRPLVERCDAVLGRLRLGSGADPSRAPSV
jgi:hypothetical protein